jgi:hypothetical protein
MHRAADSGPLDCARVAHGDFSLQLAQSYWQHRAGLSGAEIGRPIETLIGVRLVQAKHSYELAQGCEGEACRADAVAGIAHVVRLREQYGIDNR